MNSSANFATSSAPSWRLRAQEWLYRQLKRLRLLLLTRPMALLGAGVFSGAISAALLMWLTETHSFKETLHRLLFGPQSSPAGWSFLSAFLLSPVAFVLWKFRDTNQLWLIENQRKDTNLKDFQKLSEWASGTALVEDEEVSKRIYPSTVHNHHYEAEVTTSSSKPPKEGSKELNSRRMGSEALQVSAVYQLRGYLLGDFGAQFQKPAFVLLAALWQSLSKTARDTAASQLGMPDASEKRWPEEEFSHLYQSPLAIAVATCLLANQNLAFRQMAVHLSQHAFSGISTGLPGLQAFYLPDENLEGINMQGAVLRDAQLQNSSLKKAHFEGADLSNANLQGADLSSGHFRWATLNEALLSGAIIRSTDFRGAFLGGAHAQGCFWSEPDLCGTNLQSIHLEKAVLLFPNITGAPFNFSKLQGTTFINPLLNKTTKFSDTVVDEQTTVLVGVPERTNTPTKLLLSPHLTHALRIRMREENNLVLDKSAYTEFSESWHALSDDEQERIMCAIEHYCSNGFTFNDDFPELSPLETVVASWPPGLTIGH